MEARKNPGSAPPRAANGRPAPLTGLRVLDLTRVLAGPFATMQLADLGADVIKVESPDRGDPTRLFPPTRDGESHYFMSVNRNKRSIAVDLKHERGRDIVLDLARVADVLVENFRPGVMERLGLSYDRLRTVNPRLVYCSVSAFGQTGPWSGQSAYDLAIQALSGAMSVTGEPSGRPVRNGIPLADLSAGLYASIGILAALTERARTQVGRLVDVSMLDGMIGMLTYLSGSYFMTGENPTPVGSAHHSIVPYGAFEASDGYVVIAILTEAFWTKLCRALDRTDLAEDVRFSDNQRRLDRREEVNALIQAEMRKRSVAEWTERLSSFDVPHAPILSVGEALHLPQVRARDMVEEVSHPRGGAMAVTGRPLHFSELEHHPLLPSPSLGQHTFQVLEELLGYSREALEVLAQEGVISGETTGPGPIAADAPAS
jgi:formyl-CoA transferase/CoA:oxalate CoA-transferase